MDTPLNDLLSPTQLAGKLRRPRPTVQHHAKKLGLGVRVAGRIVGYTPEEAGQIAAALATAKPGNPNAATANPFGRRGKKRRRKS